MKGFFEGQGGETPETHEEVLKNLGDLGFRMNPRSRIFNPEEGASAVLGYLEEETAERTV